MCYISVILMFMYVFIKEGLAWIPWELFQDAQGIWAAKYIALSMCTSIFLIHFVLSYI